MLPASARQLSDLGIRIYPNPTSYFVTIENLGQEKIRFRLMDLQGKQISSENILPGFNKIILLPEAKATYIAHIISEKGFSKTLRIVSAK